MLSSKLELPVQGQLMLHEHRTGPVWVLVGAVVQARKTADQLNDLLMWPTPTWTGFLAAHLVPNPLCLSLGTVPGP